MIVECVFNVMCVNHNQQVWLAQYQHICWYDLTCCLSIIINASVKIINQHADVWVTKACVFNMLVDYLADALIIYWFNFIIMFAIVALD